MTNDQKFKLGIFAVVGVLTLLWLAGARAIISLAPLMPPPPVCEACEPCFCPPPTEVYTCPDLKGHP